MNKSRTVRQHKRTQPERIQLDNERTKRCQSDDKMNSMKTNSVAWANLTRGIQWNDEGVY